MSESSVFPLSWEQLPSLDLYMDQVLTLMSGEVERLSAGIDRPLTSSMINNYVKDGVLPRPERKKYNREHLTRLCIICMLKAQFTLPEIRRLLDGISRDCTTEELYAAFGDAQATLLDETNRTVAEGETLDETARYRLAMRLALEANAKRIAAAKLLATLTPAEEDPPKKEKKK